MPFSDTVLQSTEEAPDAEAAIILECDGVARTRLTGLERHYLINIDHHATARPFANVNWIDTSACATAEMIFRLAREAGGEDLAGSRDLSLHRGAHRYRLVLLSRNHASRTFGLAQELVRCGADPVHIAHNVYFSTALSKMRLLGAALSNLHCEGQLAWMHVTQEMMERCKATEEDCEGLVNYALAIGGIEVALFFRELPDGDFRVSLRSRGNVNVAAVAEAFGGGGHECASGCALDGPLSSALDQMLGQFRSRGYESKVQ